MKILIVYDSKTGNTERMAYAIKKGVESTNVEVKLKKVEDASIDELIKVEGIILGSPVYYGLPSAKIKQFIDESIKYHGKLNGKIGGAFCSAGGSHTGAETTILALNNALLIHGMIIQGTSSKNHYGAASIGPPDEENLEVCQKLGVRLGNLVHKVHSNLF
jgi:NAD(P)H dehydrogenase (quinone)